MSTFNIGGFIAREVETRAADSGRRVGATAQTLRNVAGDLREDPNTRVVADLALQCSDAVARAGTYLETTSLHQMIADAEQFSRRRPWAMATIGLTAGFMASRLVKSTAARRHFETTADATSMEDISGTQE